VCWTCGEPGHYWVSYPYRREAENDWRGKRDEKPQTHSNLQKRGDAGIYIKFLHHMLTIITEGANPSLVTNLTS
jgi:hypothetical protein